MSGATECTCKGFGCDVRIKRGLLPFCRMSPLALTPRPGYSTYAAAARARQPGQRIRSVGGGLTGSPKCFVLE